MSARVDAASIELNNITNINEKIDILSNSVELANQSAIKTASGAGVVDGLIILRSNEDVAEHNLTVELANAGNIQDNSIEIISGGSGSSISAFQLKGAVEAGDEFTVTINEQVVSYTVTGLEGSLNEVRDGLTSAINANLIAASAVIAVSGIGAAGQVSLLASVAEEIFVAANLVEQRALHPLIQNF